MTQQVKFIPSNPNARKIERVTTKQGMGGLNNQQGTHRVLFDTLPLAINTELQTLSFFKNVQTRQFPFANINLNKLDAGESLAIERAFLFLLRNTSNVLPNDVTDIQALEEVTEFSRLYHSLLNIQIAQKNVTKDIYFGTAKGSFNKDATFYAQKGVGTTSVGYNVLTFETPFILQPDIEFIMDLRIPAIAALPATGSYRLGLCIQGIGGIFDPKVNL